MGRRALQTRRAGLARVGACALALGAGGLSVLAGRALAQGMVAGGSSLDRNLMVGSGGYNARNTAGARRSGMQSDLYTVQDGRMQYNEAAAFSQPRYVPVGREGAVQSSAMIYNSRAPRSPSLATQTGYGNQRAAMAQTPNYRGATRDTGLSDTSRYEPRATSNMISARQVPVSAGSVPSGARTALPPSPAPAAAPMQEEKYRPGGAYKF